MGVAKLLLNFFRKKQFFIYLCGHGQKKIISSNFLGFQKRHLHLLLTKILKKLSTWTFFLSKKSSTSTFFPKNIKIYFFSYAKHLIYHLFKNLKNLMYFCLTNQEKSSSSTFILKSRYRTTEVDKKPLIDFFSMTIFHGGLNEPLIEIMKL